jgi:hypothetical protein
VSGYAQRVRVGGYYTDGARLAEVERVHALGGVDLRDSSTGKPFFVGIAAFRRSWWLASAPHLEDQAT